MSQTMKAVRLYEHGGPEVLKYVDVDMPDVGDDDVLIKVHMTAINQWDLRYRAGKLPKNPIPGRPGWPLPFQLGRDAAGEIVEIGKNVKRWKIGDRVVQMPHPACGQCPMCVRGLDNLCTNTVYPGHQQFGGYAQYIARAQTAILPLPDHIGYDLAAATMWAYTTPLNCAKNRAPVGVGESVMITGASSGLAIAGLQIAKLMGAKVIGTTTKPERTPAFLAMGYDVIVNSNDPNMPKQVKAMTGGLGVDAVWDNVGGTPFFTLATKCVRLGGAIAVLGAPVTDDGFELQVNIMSFIFGELNVVGVRACSRRDQELVIELLSQGKINPVIDKVFALAQADEAHAYLHGQKQIGRVLLKPW